MMKYYFKSGLFPFNCSNESFEENVNSGDPGKEFETFEEAIEFCRDLGFYRIFQMDENGNWKAVAGYAPNGSEINDLDWDILSKITAEMADNMPEDKLEEMVEKFNHII